MTDATTYQCGKHGYYSGEPGEACPSCAVEAARRLDGEREAENLLAQVKHAASLGEPVALRMARILRILDDFDVGRGIHDDTYEWVTGIFRTPLSEGAKIQIISTFLEPRRHHPPDNESP